MQGGFKFFNKLAPVCLGNLDAHDADSGRIVVLHVAPVARPKATRCLYKHYGCGNLGEKNLQNSQNGNTFQKLPFSYFACTFVWMFPTFLKIQNLLKACFFMLFVIFTFVFFAIL